MEVEEAGGVADIIMQDLRNKKVIIVRNCLECPYASIECSDVYCIGLDRRKHSYVALTQQAHGVPIPEWCPLPDQVFVKDA